GGDPRPGPRVPVRPSGRPAPGLAGLPGSGARALGPHLAADQPPWPGPWPGRPESGPRPAGWDWPEGSRQGAQPFLARTRSLGRVPSLPSVLARWAILLLLLTPGSIGAGAVTRAMRQKGSGGLQREGRGPDRVPGQVVEGRERCEAHNGPGRPRLYSVS